MSFSLSRILVCQFFQIIQSTVGRRRVHKILRIQEICLQKRNWQLVSGWGFVCQLINFSEWWDDLSKKVIKIYGKKTFLMHSLCTLWYCVPGTGNDVLGFFVNNTKKFTLAFFVICRRFHSNYRSITFFLLNFCHLFFVIVVFCFLFLSKKNI